MQKRGKFHLSLTGTFLGDKRTIIYDLLRRNCVTQRRSDRRKAHFCLIFVYLIENMIACFNNDKLYAISLCPSMPHINLSISQKREIVKQRQRRVANGQKVTHALPAQWAKEEFSLPSLPGKATISRNLNDQALVNSLAQSPIDIFFGPRTT